MVPESEFSEPTLMVSPEVSTQDAAALPPSSVALLPQAESSIEAVTTTLPANRNDLFDDGRRCAINGLSFEFGCMSGTFGPVWVSNRHVMGATFL